METEVAFGNDYFNGGERIKHGEDGRTNGFYFGRCCIGGFGFCVKCPGPTSSWATSRPVFVSSLSS